MCFFDCCFVWVCGCFLNYLCCFGCICWCWCCVCCCDWFLVCCLGWYCVWCWCCRFCLGLRLVCWVVIGFGKLSVIVVRVRVVIRIVWSVCCFGVKWLLLIMVRVIVCWICLCVISSGWLIFCFFMNGFGVVFGGMVLMSCVVFCWRWRLIMFFCLFCCLVCLGFGCGLRWSWICCRRLRFIVIRFDWFCWCLLNGIFCSGLFMSIVLWSICVWDWLIWRYFGIWCWEWMSMMIIRKFVWRNRKRWKGFVKRIWGIVYDGC